MGLSGASDDVVAGAPEWAVVSGRPLGSQPVVERVGAAESGHRDLGRGLVTEHAGG